MNFVSVTCVYSKQFEMNFTSSFILYDFGSVLIACNLVELLQFIELRNLPYSQKFVPKWKINRMIWNGYVECGCVALVNLIHLQMEKRAQHLCLLITLKKTFWNVSIAYCSTTQLKLKIELRQSSSTYLHSQLYVPTAHTRSVPITIASPKFK